MDKTVNKKNNKYKTYADGTERKRNKPNIFSRIFLWWVCPVLFKGNRRDVEEDDLIVPTKKYDSEKLGDDFERYWQDELRRAELENRPPSLWKVIVRAYWVAYLPSGIFVLISAAARTYQPQMFGQLLTYWSVDSQMSRQSAGLYALAILGLNFLALMCQHHNSLFVMRFSLRIKIACSALLYRKVLRMNQVTLGEVAGGKLVNLLSNDVARFDYAFMFLNNIWVIPIQSAAVLYLLYDAAGYAPFVGLGAAIVLILPLQVTLMKFTSIVRRQVAQRTDRRIKLMNEIINGIQVIKMYAWEIPFQLVVKAVREYEMRALRKAMFIRSSFIGFMLFTERTIMLFTVITLVFAGSMISATTIYPIQQYLSTIQFNVTMILPLAIASLSEMLVSLERIQSVLVMDEVSDTVVKPANGKANNLTFNNKTNPQNGENNVIANKISIIDNFEIETATAKPSNSEYAVEISGVNASWVDDAKPEDATLKNLSLRVRHKKLSAIIGPVGSGKTSVLQLILRELPTRTGCVKVNGTISYASQEPWLYPGTVRENILFGCNYDAAKYKEVSRVCSLQPDFKQFPYGDLSLVGDRGVSLSGGQRARINLARAIYRDADIYLLDDPLSAVDANVGRQLFENCIKGYLAKKTCILVTHQIHYLKAADQLIILNEGSIENMGTYNDLVKSGKEFSSLLANLQEGDEADDDANKKAEKRPSLHRGVSVKSDDNSNEEKEQVLEAEERAKGNLKWEVLASYISCVQSWFMIVFALASLIITQVSATTADYWISYWTNAVDSYINGLPEGTDPDPGWNTQIGTLTTAQFVYIFSGVVAALIIFSQLRIVSFVHMTMRASQNLHNMVFKSLINAVMRFFDTNPGGRILNRFSKDLGGVDELLPRSMLETLQMYLSMTSILVLNALALPWTLIPTLVLIVIFVLLLRWYLNAAQAVKRLEGTTKSPVFGMINSTLAGLSTIRSSNAETRLLRQFDNAQDIHSSAFYTFLGGSTAFGLYLDTLCLVYLAIIMCIFLLIDFDNVIPVGSVGLAVSQSMVLTMMLQMAARFTADFLAQMTSVERVLEYRKLPPELYMDEGPTQPPSQWPTQGGIVFENVTMKYGPEDPPVLRNLNFVINPAWKVGVVGRTGAGKSSLISALFRLTEIEGSIKIDSINTEGVSKKDLRSRISIIPQEPVLFSATVRYNLDPFNNYSDDDIWRALEQVELKDAVPALDFKVSEGGSNFSVGQRQLICLARAVLRSNKILVMDEATANVDPQTDALIQQTIRRQFASCTVLTIAHRLNTIMDSDRVLVMDKGQAVEFDYPYKLLSNPNSVFTFMVNETGENMGKVLYEMAKSKYFNDNPEAR
ncbi:ATP-binding cassette sub-family C member 4 [Amyelois transitella]|uniref:ATP-binding cassette sub-family C member 4 n=1 Tax=Amyelois transitella TaxID=680683 RepID=UPI00067B37F5|nr:ATP-binding cassette sub-family C member 4 [Amyelois transitella]